MTRHTGSLRSQSLSWKLTWTYGTNPGQAPCEPLKRVTDAGSKRGILDMILRNTNMGSGRGMGQRKAGQKRCCPPFSLKSHPPATEYIHQGSLSIGGWTLMVPALPWSTENSESSALRVLYTYTHKQPSNSKQPHPLVSGRPTAPLATPLNCPRMVYRNMGGRQSDRPQTEIPFCLFLRTNGPKCSCNRMRIYTVPMYMIPLLENFKVPGFKCAHSFPAAYKLPLAASREKVCP